DSSDPGLTIGLNILEGVFWAVGGSLGPIGNFTASFLSGMVAWWATSTPPNLNTTFASLLTRLQATSLAIDQQLAQYYQSVAQAWNTQFTYNGKTSTLSDFATITFPAETDPQFETLAATALFALDQQVWKTVMIANFVITHWAPDTVMPGGEESDPPVSWDEMFIANNPGYYNTWTWHNGSGCGDRSGWNTVEYNIGTSAGPFSDGSMSKDACSYLFIDSADGVVINAKGLYPRATVFNSLGIRHTTYYVPSGGGGAVGTSLSTGYLRAMKTGHTIGQLVQKEGRDAIHRRVIEQAQKDPVFARDVSMRTRQTLEKFLGVKFPEVVSVSVIVETPRTFAIVVPQPSSADGSADNA
ncbi:MAG: hypothetical protein M3N48_08675, partial [Verrucomicrobiota bacterium]|nr:hypothetical protein [Verrucomicrobiota bacterium]